MVWYKLWYGDVYTEHHCTLVANFYGMQYLQLCQNFDIGLAVWELREGEMKAIRDLKMKREKEIEKGEGRERGREGGRERERERRREGGRERERERGREKEERENKGGRETDREVPGRGLVLVS